MKDSWSIKKSMSQVMNQNLKEQYELIDRLIPNNWIRLIGAGNGGYFLISSRIKEQELRSLLVTQGIKGVFKANPSNEGLRGFEI